MREVIIAVLYVVTNIVLLLALYLFAIRDGNFVGAMLTTLMLVLVNVRVMSLGG